MERALLVTVELKNEKGLWPLEDVAEELEELAQTGGAEIVDNISCLRDKPTPNLFIGKGKTEEIAQACRDLGIDTVIFSHDLSGTQQRNLEEAIERKTIDRTQLILDIFARHARSPEGKTQVELAQLQYLLPRLVGKGIILSRLGGGIGTRGPGEQKLEVDRRRIRKRIDKLQEDLKHHLFHHMTVRKKREEYDLPRVALVGYTNAGKSTLLNALTGAGQVVSDSLFTTLDPLTKNLQLGNGEKIVVSDTVGFLHKLPHHLIDAFKATLEEVVRADLLIHVLDIAKAGVKERARAVLEVLSGLEAGDKTIITALNKIDLLEDKLLIDELKKEFPNSVPVSAKNKLNFDLLLGEIEGNFLSRMIEAKIKIPHSKLRLLDLFYKEGKVRQIIYLQDSVSISLCLPKVLLLKLLHNKEIEQIS